MSCDVWTKKKEAYRKGYVLIARELIHEYYDWEADPMCDCCPARKFHDHTGKWEIQAFRTYAYRDGNWCHVTACYEPWATSDTIPEEIFNALWKELTETDVPMIKLNDRFLEAKACELMP